MISYNARTNAIRLLFAIVSLTLICIVGAVIARIGFGPSYAGITLIDDLSINLGLIAFFVTVSGFLVIYPVNFVTNSASSVGRAVSSALLFWLCSIFFFVFVGMATKLDLQLLTLLAFGSVAVFGIDLGLNNLAKRFLPRN